MNQQNLNPQTLLDPTRIAGGRGAAGGGGGMWVSRVQGIEVRDHLWVQQEL